MKSGVFDPKSTIESNIVLWGLDDLCKKTLLWSFVRNMGIYNQAFPENFRHELFEHIPGGDRLIPMKIGKADREIQYKIQEFNWTFRRVPLIDDKSHKQSAFTHRTRITYISGKECLGALLNPDNFESALIAMQEADALILILTPNQIIGKGSTGGITGDQQNPYEKEKWTKDEYIVIIQTLLETFLKKEQFLPIYSFCVHGIDADSKSSDPLKQVEMYFGKQMEGLLRYFHNKNIPLNLFLTSSTKEKNDKDIKDRKFKESYGCVIPFSYIFQELEKAWLKKQSSVGKFICSKLSPENYKYWPYEGVEDNV